MISDSRVQDSTAIAPSLGEQGYVLKKIAIAQGKGIIRNVVHAMIQYAFNNLELNKVEIRVAVNNQKSRAIPEKLGFVKEGHSRRAEWLYDHYMDHVIYGMLYEEWQRA